MITYDQYLQEGISDTIANVIVGIGKGIMKAKSVYDSSHAEDYIQEFHNALETALKIKVTPNDEEAFGGRYTFSKVHQDFVKFIQDKYAQADKKDADEEQDIDDIDSLDIPKAKRELTVAQGNLKAARDLLKQVRSMPENTPSQVKAKDSSIATARDDIKKYSDEVDKLQKVLKNLTDSNESRKNRIAVAKNHRADSIAGAVEAIRISSGVFKLANSQYTRSVAYRIEPQASPDKVLKEIEKAYKVGVGIIKSNIKKDVVIDIIVGVKDSSGNILTNDSKEYADIVRNFQNSDPNVYCRSVIINTEKLLTAYQNRDKNNTDPDVEEDGTALQNAQQASLLRSQTQGSTGTPSGFQNATSTPQNAGNGTISSAPRTTTQATVGTRSATAP